MAPENALELVAELESLIELGGRADPATLGRMETIISSLQGTGDTTGIDESTIQQVRSWVQILFGARKVGRKRRAADDIKNILRVHCISLRGTVQAAIDRDKRQTSR